MLPSIPGGAGTKEEEEEEMTTPIGKLIKKEHAIKRKLKPLKEKHKGAKDSKTIIACELKIARLEKELAGVHKSMKVYREQKKLFNKLKQNE